MNGARIGITAARRATEQAALVTALGGVPVVGPCIDVDRPADDATVRPALEEALAAPCDVTVFTTGIGARHTLQVAERGGFADAFRALISESRTIARGSKARRMLRTLDLDADWTASPADGESVVRELTGGEVAGMRVFVQCSGPEPDAISQPLREAGATVIDAHPYSIALPPDDLPGLALVRASAAGDLRAVTFTSAHAVHGFMALAERAEIDDPVSPDTLVVSVGHVTSGALEAYDIRVGLEPDVPRMGAMFQALAAQLAEVPADTP